MAPKVPRTSLVRLVKAVKPNTLVKALSGAAILWTFLGDDGSIAAAIHRAFYRSAWEEVGPGERFILVFGFLLWLPVTPLLSFLCTRRCGPRVRRDTGKSLLRQVREQLALAGRRAIPPPWYYMFELYEDTHRARCLEYLYRFETKAALYDIMREHLTESGTSTALSDKAAFAERCRSHNLPAVPALARARDGRITRLDGGTTGLPHCDLFFKPLRGAGGRGASGWCWNGDGTYRGGAGMQLDEAALAAWLEDLSCGEEYVVRARVSNHPDLADLAGTALSTVRVLTCLDENGTPQVTHAMLRMASTTGVVVDNFHAGGIAAAVALDSGMLGPASDMGLRAESRWWDVHPVSGAPIRGRIVPHWEQVPELARRAHAAFPDQIAIGWDIAICKQGPLLVEGNKSPDLDIIQRIGREPVGNSRFGELLLFHVDRALNPDDRCSFSGVTPLSPTDQVGRGGNAGERQ